MNIFVKFTFHFVNLYMKYGRGRPRANVLGLIPQAREHVLHFIHVNRAAAGGKQTVTALPQLCTGQSKKKSVPLQVVTLTLTTTMGTAHF